MIYVQHYVWVNCGGSATGGTAETIALHYLEAEAPVDGAGGFVPFDRLTINLRGNFCCLEARRFGICGRSETLICLFFCKTYQY